MARSDADFSAEQAAAAVTALRSSLGLSPQRFSTETFVGMISDEIEQLRAAGRSDSDIAALLADSVDVRLAADEIGRYYASPERRGRPG